MMKWQSGIFAVGALLLLAGAAVMVTGWMYAPYLYSVGAVMVCAVQCAQHRKAGDVVLKRLYRQRLFGALLLPLSGVCMFTTRHNEWVVCLTVAALLQLYTAYRIPCEEKKASDRRC